MESVLQEVILMRSVIFKNIPYEILAAYRLSEEPVLRRALRRRA
jgi:hypothetical protein